MCEQLVVCTTQTANNVFTLTLCVRGRESLGEHCGETYAIYEKSFWNSGISGELNIMSIDII